MFKIIITLLIVIFPILATAQADQNPGVFFLLQKENKFYFKVYTPEIGPKTVFSVQGRPASIHWDKNFSIIFFRVNNKIFRAVWEIGATPSEILQLEKRFSSEGTAWFEPSIEKWRFTEIQYPETGTKPWKYFARVYQYNEEKKLWSLLIEKETFGCESGDGSTCGAEVTKYTQGQKNYRFWGELSRDLFLAPFLKKLGVIYKEDMEHQDLWLDLGKGRVSVVPAFGDTLHAMAPAKWSKGKEMKTIFQKGLSYPCGPKIALGSFDSYLLITAEWSGKCGKVVNLTNGKTVFKLPEKAEKAIILPLPKS